MHSKHRPITPRHCGRADESNIRKAILGKRRGFKLSRVRRKLILSTEHRLNQNWGAKMLLGVTRLDLITCSGEREREKLLLDMVKTVKGMETKAVAR